MNFLILIVILCSCKYHDDSRLPHVPALNFEIERSSGDGINPSLASLNMDQPIWKQPWFIFALALACSFALSLYYMRVVESRAISELREKICRDLHDDIGSNLSAINILSNVMREDMLHTSASGNNYIQILDRINALSNQTIESVHDIVWSMHRYESLEEIIGRMRYVGSNLLENQNINFELIIEGDTSNMKLDLERASNFFFIYKEAITNAAKYSHCSRVTTSLKIKRRKLRLSITDDGVGFNKTEVSDGNGLNNMFRRSENLRSRFQIDSKPGLGTNIAVEFDV